MTISALTLRAQVGALQLPVIDGQLSLDEARAPFAACNLTVAYNPATVDQLDPRTDARAAVTLEQRFSGSVPLSALSAEFAGKQLSHMSTAWAGLTLAGVTVRYGRAWNATGYRTTRYLRTNLGIRSREIDHAAGTVRLALASDEALLTDYGLIAAAAVTPPALTVLSAVTLALDYAVPGAQLVTTEGAQTIAAEAAAWQPGVSAWDYLLPLTSSAGLRLWCDEARVWHLAKPETIVTPGNATLAATGTVTDASDSVSRDGQDWYDGVVVTYTWTDASNVRQVRLDVAGNDQTSRTLHVNHSSPWPRAGEALARLRKVAGRGRVLGITAVADPTIYPAQAASLSIPSTPTQTGYVQSVEWSVPADTMRVGTRGLVDTPASSWAFGPAGYAWNAVPVGQDWTEFVWP